MKKPATIFKPLKKGVYKAGCSILIRRPLSKRKVSRELVKRYSRLIR